MARGAGKTIRRPRDGWMHRVGTGPPAADPERPIDEFPLACVLRPEATNRPPSIGLSLSFDKLRMIGNTPFGLSPSTGSGQACRSLVEHRRSHSTHRSGKGLCGRGLRRELKRSALRADCSVLLDLRAHGKTRYAGCARCAQTLAVSQFTKRAARAALKPALLGAP